MNWYINLFFLVLSRPPYYYYFLSLCFCYNADIDDLNEVSGYLCDLNHAQLEVLGLQMGLRLPTLKNFNCDTNATYLNELLAAWLREQDKVMEVCPPTWENLAKALESKRVSQNGIAAKIRKDKIL